MMSSRWPTQVSRDTHSEPVEVYRQRAADQRQIAEGASLGGVRQRALDAAKAWDGLAYRLDMVASLAARRLKGESVSPPPIRCGN